MDKIIGAVENALGYRFREKELLLEALTHRSFLNETYDENVKDNERLEFFGDSVLSFCISRELLARFPSSREGALTKARACLVDESSLALRAVELGLGECLLLGRGEARTGGRKKASILADAYEALLAALFLDGGIEPVQCLVAKQFSPHLAESLLQGPWKDAKTALQEAAQGLVRATPQYRVMQVSGPDHDRRFSVAVLVDGKELGRGEGRTKKEAEQQAAGVALAHLDRGKELSEKAG